MDQLFSRVSLHSCQVCPSYPSFGLHLLGVCVCLCIDQSGMPLIMFIELSASLFLVRISLSSRRAILTKERAPKTCTRCSLYGFNTFDDIPWWKVMHAISFMIIISNFTTHYLCQITSSYFFTSLSVLLTTINISIRMNYGVLYVIQ